jgi:putative transposase
VASVKHDIPEELLSALLADYIKPEDLIGKNGLLKQLTRPWLRNPYRPNTLPIMGHGR